MFLVVKFSIYLNRRVFVMGGSRKTTINSLYLENKYVFIVFVSLAMQRFAYLILHTVYLLLLLSLCLCTFVSTDVDTIARRLYY